MTKLFTSLTDKSAMFNVLKHAIDVFVWDKVTPDQRSALQRHLQKMEAHYGGYDVHCEIARGTDMRSMKLTITVNPARTVQ